MRRMGFAVVLLVLVCATTFFAVRVTEGFPASEQPDSVLIVDLTGHTADLDALRITNPAHIVTLESFFPNYRDRPQSGMAGGWEAAYYVYFDFRNGEAVRITVSADMDSTSWSTGHGDFAVRGNFHEFVKSRR